MDFKNVVIFIIDEHFWKPGNENNKRKLFD